MHSAQMLFTFKHKLSRREFEYVHNKTILNTVRITLIAAFTLGNDIQVVH